MSGFGESFKQKLKKFWQRTKELSKKFAVNFVRIIKKIWVWLVLGAIALGIISGVALYTSSIRKTLYKSSVENMLEVTAQDTLAFANYIEKDLDASTRLVDRLSAVAAENAEGVNSILRVINAQTTTYRVTIVKGAQGTNLTGRCYDNIATRDEETVSDDVLKNLKSLFASKGIDVDELPELTADNKLEGLNKIQGVMEPRELQTGDETLDYITYYTAFQFERGSLAVLQEYRAVSDVMNRFSLSFYNGEGYSFVINSQGEIMFSPEDNDDFNNGDNLFDRIETAGNKSKGKDFKYELSENSKGHQLLKLNGQETLFAYDKIENTDDWYMISIVPKSVVTKQNESIISTSTIFGVIIAFVVVIVVFIIVIVQRNRRVMVEKDGEIIYREQLFDILANNTDEVFIMISHEDMSVDYVSPNVERVLGVNPREVKKDISSLGRAKYPKKENVDFSTLEGLQMGSSLVYETERLHKITNERRYFIETVYRVQSDQNEKFIVAIADRTEELFSRQSLEEALNIAKVANKAKSAFLANMSHDIRTPMNAIVGLCTLLERDVGDKEKVREHVKQISLSSKHMLEIINDILDMSKIESGETSINISQVNISDLIKEIDNIVRPQTKAKEQSFNIVVAVQEGVFLGDKLRIKRIMMNILSNAVKFTPEGGRIDFTIRQMARASKKYVRIQFIIKDNGIGMSSEFQKHVFEPFTKQINSDANTSQGTGLGLPIAKNLVDLMGGTIAVDSKEGEGTTVTVNIKFQLSEDEGNTDFWSEHGIERIMVIGCGAADRDSISDAMSKSDVTINFADGVNSALSLAARAQKDGKHYDAVIVDWQSTEGERMRLIEGLRKALPNTAPIIAFGEHDWSETESKVIEAGLVKDFLVKPFFLSSFMECFANKTANTAQAVSSGGALNGLKFLAAEDNELNSMILVELLNTAGAKCIVKKDGKEAVEEFEKSVDGSYDAILMDVQMPVMNGYDATRAIRACDHPGAKKIPIIAMTANAFADDVQKSLAAGMDAHLSKPVDMAELERTIVRIKGNKQQ